MEHPLNNSIETKKWTQEETESLRKNFHEHTMNVLINIDELRKKARIAKTKANIEWNSNMQARFMPDLNSKAMIALSRLSDKVAEHVNAHGLGLRSVEKDVEINTLVSILVSGELKGDWAPVKGYIPVFKNAPFILLSNKDEALTKFDNEHNLNKVTGLRTVLVNGVYEGILDDLKKAFPFVSFRTSDQIDDEVFDTSKPPYKSYSEREEEAVQQRVTSV